MVEPADPVYPVVFFDTLRVKSDGIVKSKAAYVALALAQPER
jgi:hypothetical protein